MWTELLGSDAGACLLQMAEGAAVLRDSAQAAVGCDAAAEELVSGQRPASKALANAFICGVYRGM